MYCDHCIVRSNRSEGNFCTSKSKDFVLSYRNGNMVDPGSLYETIDVRVGIHVEFSLIRKLVAGKVHPSENNQNDTGHSNILIV